MRVLVAARLSKLADGQTGLDTQDQEAKAWALRENHEIVHVAADRKSGTVQPWKRPNLRPWVTEPAKMSQYDAVVAYRLDRLSRGNNQSTNEIEKWAHDNGKLLLTVDGLKFPCEGADGIRWDVAKRISHDEWLKCSERYQRMQGYLKNAGKLVGRPPFGYEPAPAEGGHKTLVPTAEGRRYVPGIFSRIAAGDSLRSVCTWLDSEGVKPRNAEKWWPRSLAVIVRNPAYMGQRCESITVTDPQTGKQRMVYGKKVLDCEALADAATWRAANDALKARPQRRQPRAEHPAMLAGIVYCPRCSSPMYRIHAGRGASARYYYRCAGSGPQRRGCGNMARLREIDEAVASLITVYGWSPVIRHEFVPGTDNAAELERLRFEMSQLSHKNLSWADEDRERAALRAAYDELAGQPDTPDHMEEVDTGMKFSQVWAELDSDTARNAFLREQGFRAGVTRERVKLAQVRHPRQMTAEVTLESTA
jgi:DNA invertase Pin-like site-specific DNA recombinase